MEDDRSPLRGETRRIWQLKWYHPTATQEMRLVVETREGELSGSLINEAAGLTVPISEAKVDGRQMTFTVVMTKPYPVNMAWEGTIEGDSIAGTAAVHSMSPFPFDGKRITQR